MSHAQPCRYGFANTACPECRDRNELTIRVADAPEDTLREIAHWLIDNEPDALKDALNGAQS